MNETYTRKQAMELLGISSLNTFLRMERKYPEIFMNMNPYHYGKRIPWYDRAKVDKFAKAREHFKQEKL